MRPLKLKMQAFGPFRDVVELPFSNLGEGNIYLICGVTGSGKTTIFDAICYALFNTSSTQKRGNITLRSHFASENEKSFVEFDFLFNGEKYSIVRYPSYERKKAKGTGNIQESAKAILYLPDGKIIEKVKDVDEYIINILGINCSQFSQIALLAQGEFLKLLNSDSQTRAEIFRNIFKTSDFAYFQQRLKDKTIEYKNIYTEIKNSILQYINDIKTTDIEIASLKEKYTKNSCFDDLNYFCSLVEKQNCSDNSKLTLYKKKIDELEKEIKAQQDYFSNIQAKINLLNQKESIEKEMQNALFDFNDINKEYLKINEKRQIAQTLALEINQTQKNYQKSLEIKELMKNKNSFNQEILSKKEVIINLEQSLREAKVNYAKKLINDYLCQKISLEKLQNEFLNCQKEAHFANADYELNYNEYLKIQAGIIASTLKPNMPCPVCGSNIHPNLATLENKNLTKEFIDKLKNYCDECNLKLSQFAQKCSVLNEKVINLAKIKDDYLSKNSFIMDEIIYDIKNIDFEKEIEKISNDLSLENDLLIKLNSEYVIVEAKINTLLADIKNLDIDKTLADYKLLCEKYENLSKEIDEIEKKYNNLNILINKLKANSILLDKQILDYSNIDVGMINKIKTSVDDFKNQIEIINDGIQKTITIKSINENALKSITKKEIEFNKISKTYSDYKILSECANGNMSGKAKIPFEQYIQGYYFDMVLYEANKRLKIMTNNQFQLLRKKDSESLLSKTALDLEVMDFHTFKKRSTKTLSGGESFKAALSLALGLSDCVSKLSGAINIDSLFIDEGFGSLDYESLELAMDVIFNLSSNNKLIGIISHIEDLKTKVPNQILALKSDNGSKIEINF